MKHYFEPAIKIIALHTQDVVTTSNINAPPPEEDGAFGDIF